jgi:hypothetical protein
MQLLACALPAAVLAAGGCANDRSHAASTAPLNLRPPGAQVVSLETFASGVQIYECASKPDQPSTYEWTFRSPEATLVDRSGRTVGKHYAGPTWESIDGSSVIGEVSERDPGPTPSAIPWLLLRAKATAGAGMFTPTKSIQRLRTAGGVAPTEPCGAANAKQLARVPYKATYVFYVAAP